MTQGLLGARERRGSLVFVAVAFGLVVLLCVPAMAGLDANYLVIATPIAQWIPALAVLLAVGVRRRRESLSVTWRMRPVRGTPTRSVIGLVTAAILMVPAIHVSLGIGLGLVEWTPVPDMFSIVPLILPIALLALLSAIGEEVGWRGYLWTRIRHRTGFWVTAFVIGLIWSAWHLPVLLVYGVQDDIAWRNVAATAVDLVAASFVLGAGRELSGTVWPAAWGHALVNSVLVFTSSSLVTQDVFLDDASFWQYRALGWAAWLVAAGMLVAVGAATTRSREPARPGRQSSRPTRS